MFPFYTPWKYQKTSGFLIFSVGIERATWPEMGLILISHDLTFCRGGECLNASVIYLKLVVFIITLPSCPIQKEPSLSVWKKRATVKRLLSSIFFNMVESFRIVIFLRDLSFSTYAKFSENLRFLTPWNAHELVRIRRG